MDREKAIKLFRRDIECLSHDKCSDCILEEACDPMKTPPDSEYIAAYGMAIEALSAEPCDDAISRQAVMDFIRGLTRWCVRSEDGKFNNVGLLYDDVMFGLDRLPSVTPKQKMGHCKECKYFEYDSVAKVDGIPLIVAHEICSKWGDGCKTKEDGYCFLFEPQESEDVSGSEKPNKSENPTGSNSEEESEDTDADSD